MDFAKKYNLFLDMQQRRFPEWIVQDHGAGGHVEMMKDVIAKDGSKVMVFFWNDESATIYRHPMDKNRYISMEEYNDPNIIEKLWDDHEEYSMMFLYREGDVVDKSYECTEVFDSETVQDLSYILLKLKEVHAKWDEMDDSYESEKVTVNGQIGSEINYTIEGPSEIPFLNHDLKLELALGMLKTIDANNFGDKRKFQNKLNEIQEVINDLSK